MDHIIETALIDGKPAPGSALVRLSAISGIGPMIEVKLVKGGLRMVPAFDIILGGKMIRSRREVTDGLLRAKEIRPGAWEIPSQPDDGPSHLATKKFREDLIIAWAEAIKAEWRAGSTQTIHM